MLVCCLRIIDVGFDFDVVARFRDGVGYGGLCVIRERLMRSLSPQKGVHRALLFQRVLPHLVAEVHKIARVSD